MTVMTCERLIELDIAKGICILLMVVGHSGMPDGLHFFIYGFHMPFFFFVSGITTNVSRPFKTFLSCKIKGLMIPFFIYYLIHIPSYALVYKRSIIEQFIVEFEEYQIDSALWFVPILFLANIINWMIPRKKFVEMVAVLILSTSSSVLCIENISLPYNLSVLGFGASFVLLGRLLSVKGVKDIFQFCRSYGIVFGGIVISMVVTLGISLRYRLAMSFDKIEPCLPIMVGALAGILMILLFSGMFSLRSRVLSRFFAYTGLNTFVFIGFSQFILKYENLYIRDLVILKYCILFITLYLLVYLKNRIPFAKTLRL